MAEAPPFLTSGRVRSARTWLLSANSQAFLCLFRLARFARAAKLCFCLVNKDFKEADAVSEQPDKRQNVTRRSFLQTSTAAAAASFASLPQVHAAGSDILRVGLIGCGGRGTGAAEQALRADPNVKLVAMGDAFKDRLDYSYKELIGTEAIKGKIDVPGAKKFVGFDAYQQVINSGVDVVVLATPPHFRPAHIEAAVNAKKHIFAEKPVAVDAPGVHKVMAACEKANKLGLSVVSGLCWRYHGAMQAIFSKIHEGGVGDIVALHTSYNTGALWHKDRKPDMSDMEWQMRNWLYFTWLSGDHNVEQHIHSLDKMAWAMQDNYPVKAVGLGGRQVRTGDEFGHIFDHHAVVYEFENGVKCFSFCRQQAGTHGDVSDHVMGTKGTAEIMDFSIKGEKPWKFSARKARAENMYQNEHNELFRSIRQGKPINNGNYMSKSTLMAIMGRMATYTGQEITWEMALKSKEDLTPPKYAWGPLPIPPVARPGVTRFS